VSSGASFNRIFDFADARHPVLGATTQPASGRQVSHGSHSGGGPPTQVPPLHVSPVVQSVPSLHGLVFGVKTHWPVCESHASSVHGFPSLQMVRGPLQTPLAVHVVPLVQASASTHAVPAGRKEYVHDDAGCEHVVAAHPSTVQSLPSSHAAQPRMPVTECAEQPMNCMEPEMVVSVAVAVKLRSSELHCPAGAVSVFVIASNVRGSCRPRAW
jgi:hypothetical protein